MRKRQEGVFWRKRQERVFMKEKEAGRSVSKKEAGRSWVLLWLEIGPPPSWNFPIARKMMKLEIGIPLFI